MTESECKQIKSETSTGKKIPVAAFVSVVVALILIGIAAVFVSVLYFYGHLECIGCVPEFDIIVETDGGEQENGAVDDDSYDEDGDNQVKLSDL